MRLSSLSTVLAGAGLMASAGCPNREVSEVNPSQDKVEPKEIPLTINRDIDVLFVIDNSGSMAEEQNALVANFPQFITTLEQIEGGLPNVHLGVVSSDMGTLGVPTGDPACSDPDNGNLLKGDPDLASQCTMVTSNYISDEDRNSDGVRETNYTGTLADAFTCTAKLGKNGCGFEQHLESMRAALNNNPVNDTFLRSSAYLAVIVIADEDDCSAEMTSFFGPESPALGPLDSFRCFEKAVRCNEGSDVQLRDVGVKTGCQLDPDQHYLYEVQDRYVTFLKGLKTNPRNVITAGIIGPTDPVEVGRRTPMGSTTPRPDLVPSCSYTDINNMTNTADNGFRLRSFFESFPDRNTFTTICDSDYTDALVQIAELLRTVIGYPCIEAALADKDGDPSNGIQADCQFSYVTDPHLPTEMQVALPRCDPEDGPVGDPRITNKPCWHLVPDPMNCSGTPTDTGAGGLSVVVERDQEPPPNTYINGGCVVQ
jgi:hypothetical protein